MEQSLAPGARLFRRFLAKNKIRLVDAAAALGVTAPAVHDWTDGRRRPQYETRIAIAQWTGDEVPVDSWTLRDERAPKAVVPFTPQPIAS